MSYAISMIGVNQTYQHFRMHDLELKVETGSMLGIIGANGAGKSTLLRILMGLIRPDSGQVCVLDCMMPDDQARAKQEIGYASEDMRLYESTTLAKHIEWMRFLYPKWDDAYAQDLIKRFQLIPQQLIRGLSHGQRVKSMLLLALARKPKLLLLDEPTTGLDPIARHQVNRELMRIMEDGERTVVFSSQNTQDIEQVCDYIAFLDQGRIIASDDRESYLERWRRLRLEWSGESDIPTVNGLQIESATKYQACAICNSYDESTQAQLEQAGIRIATIERMTLEEIFVHTVQREAATTI